MTMRPRVGVLTDFLSYDPAYSLCQGARANIRMLKFGGYEPVLFVRQDFDVKRWRSSYENVEIVPLNPGSGGTNRVRVDENSEHEICDLVEQMSDALALIDVVLTHDLIYQANLWKYHVAARRLARARPDLRWLHWVHSVTNLNVAGKTGPYVEELEGPFPRSKLVLMVGDLAGEMASRFGYTERDVTVIPHPLDLTESYHPLARTIIDEHDLWSADLIVIYPCRLDRGKRPHLVILLLCEVRRLGLDARFILCDFHSQGGDKQVYREEMRAMALEKGVPVVFASDLDEAKMRMPHQAILDLMDFGDLLVQPSISEAYSRVVMEAAWKRCGLVLNVDLPAFGRHADRCIGAQFSLRGDDEDYRKELARRVADELTNNTVLAFHRVIRKERNLHTTWETHLRPLIEDESAWPQGEISVKVW